MSHYDLIFIDDEVTLGAMFSHLVRLKFPAWQTLALSDSSTLFEQITNRQVSAAVWIVDLMMPDKNGFEIAAAIRQVGPPETVIIGYTALEPANLSQNPEYAQATRYFNRIAGKQESLLNLLAEVSGTINR
jgi:CheY-like chemotaxis protein